MARQYLEPAEYGAGWRVTDGDEVVGRFIWSETGAAGIPLRPIIDGRTVTWDQFGEALSAYEGWNVRLLIEDRRAEAEIETETRVIDITQTPQPARTPVVALPQGGRGGDYLGGGELCCHVAATTEPAVRRAPGGEGWHSTATPSL